jgi:hypothetical protein
VRGTLIPWQTFTRSNGSLRQRDLVSGTPASSGSFIQTQRLPDIADALRPVSQVIASGATVLTDLKDGGISWPRWQTPSTPSAYTEIGPVTNNTQTASLMVLKAHRISSATVVVGSC